MSWLKCVLSTYLGVNGEFKTELNTRPHPSMSYMHSHEKHCGVCNCKDNVQALFLIICFSISTQALLLFKSKQFISFWLFTISSLRAGFLWGSTGKPAWLKDMFPCSNCPLQRQAYWQAISYVSHGIHLIVGNHGWGSTTALIPTPNELAWIP